MKHEEEKHPGADAASGESGSRGLPGEGQAPGPDFIRARIIEDNASGRYDGRVHTRFPPEPNGYLHIGHAKSICLNFGVAGEFGGLCNLRMDDTDPTKESTEYVEAIMRDVRWLGFDWQDRMYFASDYYDQLYEWAIKLINKGKAYVDDLDEEKVREYRGTVTQPGRPSPCRDRPIQENLALFERMKSGEFEDGKYTLRAKIDMASPNMKMRDPLMYRIRHVSHYRSGDKWCLYPMYDFTHGQSDSIEGITHSICTLEFENNRELYDWFLRELEIYEPQQIEFARLNLSHTVMSKRLLLDMVEEGLVSGWDDPRMPTICGLRRRGYSPEGIRTFCDRIGVAKRESTVDIAFLEHCLREDLNRRARRVMAVLRPLKLVVENYPADRVEMLEAVNNPENAGDGTRHIPFSRVVYIERDDFREDPPKKYFRLSPGAEVRLKHAYVVRCVGVEKDSSTGEVVEVRCTYDPETKSGTPSAERRVKGTLHWVSAPHALEAEVRLYDHLFTVPNPLGEGGPHFKKFLNPRSVEVLTGCKVEPSLGTAAPGEYYQFLREGYFVADLVDSKPGSLVFNRSVGLRDTWAKIEKSQIGI